MTTWRKAALRNLLFIVCFLLASAGLFLVEALAQDKDRSRSLNFEDSLIEGVNKRPYDSLSQINEKNKKKKKPHLYRKRPHFRPETEETLREVRFVQ